MKALLCAGIFALATVGGAAQESKLGTGVSLKEATPVKTLLNHPEEFVGKTIRVDGIATAVCEEMGCWMAIAPADDPKGATVRIKVEDGVIKFPVTAKGKRVSAEGIFEEVKAEHGAEHAEHGKAAGAAHGAGHAAGAQAHPAEHDAKAGKKYQIKATGAVVR